MTLPLSSPYASQKIMKLETPSYVECRGTVKFCGFYSQGQQWKSGKIVLENRQGDWWCSMIFDCSKNNKASASVKLKKIKIKKVVCKSRLIVEFSDGSTFLLHHAKSDTNLRDLTHLLNEIQSGNINLRSPGKPVISSKENVIVTPTHKSPGQDHTFTKVKDVKPKTEFDVDLMPLENLQSENLSVKKTPPIDFLNRSAEKCRETLKTIGSSSFYSNKTQTPSSDRVFGTYSSQSSLKRTPGLMPDPTPSKRPRLSNVQYSWSKNKTNTSSDHKYGSALQGFSNLGNTCYMNAILQSLFGLETFAHDLLLGNRRLLRTLSRDSLYHNLSKLLITRKKPGVADSVRRDLLRNVKTAISSSAKRFSGYQQHDAHEFLGQVLDQLKEEILKINKATPSPCKDTGVDLQVTGQEYINPTIQNFEFEVLHSIQCTDCGEKVTKAEQFNDLSLDLPRRCNTDDPRTIQDALDLFLRDEKLEYTCAECGCKQSQVFHSFTRLPRVLVVHLKRYVYSSESQNTKMGRSVFIPKYLTLQSFCDSETRPPYPPTLPPVGQSPATVILNTSKESPKPDITRRKLDYTGNRFSGTFRRVRAVPSDSEEDTWMALEKKPHHDSSGDIKVPEDGDDEFKHVIELSGEEPEEGEIREPEEKVPESKEESTDMTEDQQLEKALELSRMEAQQNSTIDMSELQLENMTEEEMFRLAMERSILESTNQEPESPWPISAPSSNENRDHSYQKSNVIRECSAEVINTFKNDRSKSTLDSDMFSESSTKNSYRSRKNSDASPVRWQKGSNSNHTNTSETKTYCDLENLALSPICRNTYSKASLKGGATKWDRIVNNETKKDVAIFSSDDEVILVKDLKDCKNQPNKIEVSREIVQDDLDEVDGGKLPEIGKSIITQTDEDLLFCEEQDEDLEDKENKTPPHSASNSKPDPDWLTSRDQGNKELQDVMTFDLDEEDEDIRKAKELSLQELDNQSFYEKSEEDGSNQESAAIIRTKEETESLKKHFEDGHLPYSYRLVSVVSHIGSTSSTGHYISDVYDFKKGEWFSYNDSHVTKLTETEIRQRRERSGYIFFYMCKNIHEDLRVQNKLQRSQKEVEKS